MTASDTYQCREACVDTGGHIAAFTVLYLSPSGRGEEGAGVRCSFSSPANVGDLRNISSLSTYRGSWAYVRAQLRSAADAFTCQSRRRGSRRSRRLPWKQGP